jgi:uncharacterized protein YqeY
MLTEINQKIIKSIKPGGDKFEAKCLKLLKAELLNNQKTITPRDELDLVKSYVKKLKKALKAFHSYPERLKELEHEVEIISIMLPPEVSEERVRAVVETIVQNIMSADMPNKSEMLQKYRGRIIGSTKKVLPDADGGLIAQITIEEINKTKEN